MMTYKQRRQIQLTAVELAVTFGIVLILCLMGYFCVYARNNPSVPGAVPVPGVSSPTPAPRWL